MAATIAPATIDEDFRGFVQLSLSGLETGATVRVEKFQVNNSNGEIDGAAILEQSFLLTDGISNVIAGVANSNVPADSTPADGTIAAQLSFLDDYVPNTIGEYVFRFSSPSGAFAPFTARFTVEDFPDAQNFTGTVRVGATPLAFAHVVLLDTSGGGYDFVAATKTDANGNYVLGSDPGEYDLVSVKRGFVGAFGRGVQRELAADADQTADLTLVPGTRTISGQLRDRTNTAQALAGVQIVFRSEDGKFTVDYTDANGNFSTLVTPGAWQLEVERNALNQLGYLTSGEARHVDTSAGNVTNLVISVPRATALLHGTIRKVDGTPLANTEVDAASADGQFESFTVTDENGNYVIAVGAGDWLVAPTAGDLVDDDFLSPEPEERFIANGTAVQVDFAVTPSNARLSGSLVDETGAPVGDIDIGAEEIGGGKRYLTFFTDEEDGTFDIGLTDGTWRIVPDIDWETDTDLIFIDTPVFKFAAGQTIAGVQLRAQRPTRHIIVTVLDDEGEPYEAAEVGLRLEKDGHVFYSLATTDEDGEAQLPAFDGTWTVSLTGPELEADGFREPEPVEVAVNGSDPAVEVQLELLPETGNTLVNLATRGVVQTGDNVLIGGFIITGNAPKQVLIRAIGPSLRNAGVNDALDDPTLTLFDSNGGEIAFNDDWTNSEDRQAIADTTIPPTNDKESALLRTLTPGAYTARLGGAGNSTGIALVEIYDLSSQLSSRLANIATRGRVQTGEDVLIGGYIVGGYQAQRLVIRAIGPSLGNAGVPDALADPVLTVVDAQGTAIASNNNWEDTQRQQLIDTTLAPTHPNEAAVVITLDAANYTAVVSGVNNSTGVGLVEIYNITPDE